ncbi:hypothetical protein BX666DRAFT_740769 [Dichotomocladium elegans]|nr:hypothetical protein BX666DRAFT_740769 [Dichotomocladium elegans]
MVTFLTTFSACKSAGPSGVISLSVMMTFRSKEPIFHIVLLCLLFLKECLLDILYCIYKCVCARTLSPLLPQILYLFSSSATRISLIGRKRLHVCIRLNVIIGKNQGFCVLDTIPLHMLVFPSLFSLAFICLRLKTTFLTHMSA